MAQEVIDAENALYNRLHGDAALMRLVQGVFIELLDSGTPSATAYPAIVIQSVNEGDTDDVKSLSGVRAFVTLSFNVFVIGATNSSRAKLKPAADKIDELLHRFQQEVPETMLILVERAGNLREQELASGWRDYPKLGGVYAVTVCPNT